MLNFIKVKLNERCPTIIDFNGGVQPNGVIVDAVKTGTTMSFIYESKNNPENPYLMTWTLCDFEYDIVQEQVEKVEQVEQPKTLTLRELLGQDIKEIRF